MVWMIGMKKIQTMIGTIQKTKKTMMTGKKSKVPTKDSKLIGLIRDFNSVYARLPEAEKTLPVCPIADTVLSWEKIRELEKLLEFLLNKLKELDII